MTFNIEMSVSGSGDGYGFGDGFGSGKRLDSDDRPDSNILASIFLAVNNQQ